MKETLNLSLIKSKSRTLYNVMLNLIHARGTQLEERIFKTISNRLIDKFYCNEVAAQYVDVVSELVQMPNIISLDRGGYLYAKKTQRESTEYIKDELPGTFFKNCPYFGFLEVYENITVLEIHYINGWVKMKIKAL